MSRLTMGQPLRDALGDEAADALLELLEEILRDRTGNIVVRLEEPEGPPEPGSPRVLVLPKPLRDRLGDEAAAGLVDFINERAVEVRRRSLARMGLLEPS
ncbi:MAG TPA: hypothetical protein EYP55_07615 [Anaerolineae bacterium]|nr:hypothetical protein [Anaerolineae bacterium]